MSHMLSIFQSCLKYTDVIEDINKKQRLSILTKFYQCKCLVLHSNEMEWFESIHKAKPNGNTGLRFIFILYAENLFLLHFKMNYAIC